MRLRLLFLPLFAVASAPADTLEELGELTRFELDGRRAFVLKPRDTEPEAARPWVFYAPTFHASLPNKRDEGWMFERFLAEGIAIAGIDVGESYGSPAGRAAYAKLHAHLVAEHGFSEKACLLPRSRGGLMLYNWAVENPGKVACVAGIYPVCDPRSYPGLARAAPAYGMTAGELEEALAGHNPVDRIAPLAEAGVPIFHIHGNVDRVVPLGANSDAIAKRYAALGGDMRLVVPRGQGHNMWPGFFRCAELVDFVIGHATGSPPAAPRAELVWDGGLFTEGPAVARDGAVLFSDVGANSILRIGAEGGKAEPYRIESGRANGLVFDPDGQLIACEGANTGGGRRISITDADGKVSTLADEWQGKRFNSPNDLALDAAGNVYFTDPRYVGDEPRDLDFEGVFLVRRDRTVSLATRETRKPNGILISHDGKTAYVADHETGPDGVRQLLAFAIAADGSLSEKRVLHDFGAGRGIDGMAMDAAGNIYATAGAGAQAGIHVFDPGGHLLHVLRLPGDPTNCTFNADESVLYVTAQAPAGRGPRTYGLYRIALRQPAGDRAFPRPIAHWKLDGEGDSARDSAGDHHGTVLGAKPAEGRVGGGRLFTRAKGDHIAVRFSEDFEISTFTVAAWVKLSAGPTFSGILGTRFGKDFTFDMKVNDAKVHGDIGDGSRWIETKVNFYADDTGSTDQGGDLPVGRWFHIVFVIDDAAKRCRLYLDGDLKKTIPYEGTPKLMQPGQSMHIGHSSTDEFMDGIIDEVKIWSAALSSEQVVMEFEAL